MVVPGVVSDKVTVTELVKTPPLGEMVGAAKKCPEAKNGERIFRADINFAVGHGRRGEFDRRAGIVARQDLAAVVKFLGHIGGVVSMQDGRAAAAVSGWIAQTMPLFVPLAETTGVVLLLSP